VEKKKYEAQLNEWKKGSVEILDFMQIRMTQHFIYYTQKFPDKETCGKAC
jgi:hypothetical protein